MFKLYFILSLLLVSFIFSSCEDTTSPDYVEDFIVEALIIVDEPLQNLTVMRSQPINSIFNYDSSMVKDANVKIIGDGREFELKYRTREDGGIGYYLPDTSYKVKSGIEYKLEITLKNGRFITGKTTTPPTTTWRHLPANIIQFPLDTIKLPAGDSISWNKVDGYDFYLFSVKNLDTMNYGVYLDPPTTELNRRIYRPLSSENAYREAATTFPIPSTKTPVVWNAFRWFGRHSITLLVPDWNFLRWFLQAQSKGEADPLLTSVEGAIGYFGSASAIKFEFFLLKNQQ